MGVSVTAYRNRILCPSCADELVALGNPPEHKCCSHACGRVTCTRCGAESERGQDDDFICAGSVPYGYMEYP